MQIQQTAMHTAYKMGKAAASRLEHIAALSVTRSLELRLPTAQRGTSATHVIGADPPR